MNEKSKYSYSNLCVQISEITVRISFNDLMNQTLERLHYYKLYFILF